MLDGLRYTFQLRRLQANRRRLRKKYKKLYDEAKQQDKSREELMTLLETQDHEIDPVDEDIWHLQMNYLLEKAENNFVPTPDFNTETGEWIESYATNRWRLSPDALAKVRTDIRREQKERREVWLTWLTPLTGFIGALIGLVAILSD